MLTGLTIRDIVLIERLDLEVRSGLGVLTGETGAGKSILLDSLGLCLGARADAGLLRSGAQKGQVSAEFSLNREHPARRLLAEHDLDEDDMIVVRRVLGSDGRSRAFINDQPVSVGLMRELGSLLVEVQGQHDRYGLLDVSSHRGYLDGFAGTAGKLDTVALSYDGMSKAVEALAEAEAALAAARDDEDYLRHVLAELDEWEPAPGEEAELAETRGLLMNAGHLTDAVAEAEAAMGGTDGAAARLRDAERALERVAEKAAGKLDGVLRALEKASIETAEAAAAIEDTARTFDAAPGRLTEVEDRLFRLRELARKHRVEVDGLAWLRDTFAARLAAIDGGADHIAGLKQAAEGAREDYVQAAADLSKARRRAAAKLDKAVAAELGPLKLDKARFRTIVEGLDESDWGRAGADRIVFEVATNPGQPPGPLTRVASGGELSRFLLALKVVLAATRAAPTLIFDEVDSGIGGATAEAVGERLVRLAEDNQVLVVTHSPQVAARGDHHWRVAKSVRGKNTVTEVGELDEAARREELARMLAGATVTDEARAAADSLIAGQAS